MRTKYEPPVMLSESEKMQSIKRKEMCLTEFLSFSHCHLGVNFTNILRAAFAPISLRRKIINLSLKYKKLLERLSYKKFVHKMLVKLTIALLRLFLHWSRVFASQLFFTFSSSNREHLVPVN